MARAKSQNGGHQVNHVGWKRRRRKKKERKKELIKKEEGPPSPLEGKYYKLMFFICFFPCRNRLENNTEHWNALLLSLRELIEWVIRKDTELTGLGPIRGDLSTLVKQQVNRNFFFSFFSCPPLAQEKCFYKIVDVLPLTRDVLTPRPLSVAG
jgi:hypothetical protein